MTGVKAVITPAMYEHAVHVYMAMEEAAEYDEELGQSVYEGHLTQLFKKLHLSVPYYTTIKNRLTAMGCIEQVKRGGGSAQSRWIVWQDPTLELWIESVSNAPRAKGDKVMVMEQRYRDMKVVVSQLEARIKELETNMETTRKLLEEYRSGHDAG